MFERVAEAVTEVLADGEWHWSVAVKEQLAALDLAPRRDDRPGEAAHGRERSFRRAGARTDGRRRPVVVADGRRPDTTEPRDPPADEKPAADGPLMDAALRWNEGRA